MRWGSGEQIWIEEAVEKGFHPCCEWKRGGQRSSSPPDEWDGVA